ncbi:MAG TPA: gluconate:H+ symporter [Propionicimonas sp.]|nr:gluconate:H+ symporter [Propionicimonas sp.]HQA78493.1 gluconate:H+ symporter [Propionicimonas sp.]HQD95821.1 gluconate:H+ symporter [Propionicimonas sp.]
MTTPLILAALGGIATIVVLIVWLKVHPFLSLMAGSAVMAIFAGVPYPDLFKSFTAGLGSTLSGVGLLIILGAIIGTLLVSSGGADVIVDTILAKTPLQRLPWAMALIAFVVGIPLFFEVGVVILIPVVMFAARRANLPVVLLGIPALAGLSALHGLVPPHPGPLIAIDALGANLGLTLGLGLLVAIPCVIIAGPLLGKVMAKWVPIEARSDLLGSGGPAEGAKRPSFGAALTVVLLPVILMLARTVVEMTGAEENPFGAALVFVGTPLIALTITTIAAMFMLGFLLSKTRDEVSKLVGSAFGPIAGILLIVGAGGGFKQTLVDSGIADVIAKGLADAALPPLLAGWIVAVLIRLATGSATVATITASGIMAPLAAGLPPTHAALMVLAIGAGSVFLSHVNDAGFWMVKEYFGMSVGQTFKTWSLMETVLSVTGLAGVMLLSLVV